MTGLLSDRLSAAMTYPEDMLPDTFLMRLTYWHIYQFMRYEPLLGPDGDRIDVDIFEDGAPTRLEMIRDKRRASWFRLDAPTLTRTHFNGVIIETTLTVAPWVSEFKNPFNDLEPLWVEDYPDDEIMRPLLGWLDYVLPDLIA